MNVYRTITAIVVFVALFLGIVGCTATAVAPPEVAEQPPTTAPEPIAAATHIKQGEAYMEEEQYELAIEEYNIAISLNPQAKEPYLMRGLANLNLENYDLALNEFNSMIQEHDQIGDGYFFRGIYYTRTKEYELAFADLQTALELGMTKSDYRAYAEHLVFWVLDQEPAGILPCTVQMPQGAGWRRDLTADYLVFLNEGEGQITRIDVSHPWVRYGMRPETVEYTANRFRNREEANMSSDGSIGEKFELVDVEKGTVTVGERDFYYMFYREVWNEAVVGIPVNVDGRIYLFFPEDYDESQYFYAIVITHTYIRGQPHDEFSEAETLALLESFAIETP